MLIQPKACNLRYKITLVTDLNHCFMNKISLTALLFFSLILVSSCSKEVEETQNSTSSPQIKAGVYDGTYEYHDYQPGIQATINWDAQNLYGYAYDSIDLDLNGSYDLYITINALNMDSAYLLQGALPNPFPNITLSTPTEFEIGKYTETYPIGLGQTATVEFADRLDYDERVDVITNWNSGCTMWQSNPTATMPYGDWYSANATYYLGVRKNGSLYGWIEVDATDSGNPIFESFAIQQ